MILKQWVKLWGQVSGKPKGKILRKWGKTSLYLVVPKGGELCTKLSTVFSTLPAEVYPRIHRPYYYNNLY